MKVHLLQHLPDVVEWWGPLWAYSTFWFESLNRMLQKYVHGTRFVYSQVGLGFLQSKYLYQSKSSADCLSSINNESNSEDSAINTRPDQ